MARKTQTRADREVGSGTPEIEPQLVAAVVFLGFSHLHKWKMTVSVFLQPKACGAPDCQQLQVSE